MIDAAVTPLLHAVYRHGPWRQAGVSNASNSILHAAGKDV